jgi:hypothetical protein
MKRAYLKTNYLGMKKGILIILFIGMLGIFSGCDLDDDGYSLSDMWLDLGIVTTENGSHNILSIKLDDGATIYPVANANPYFEFNNNQRVLVNFTILGEKTNSNNQEEYYVRINRIDKVLYKGIFDITPATEDSIGHDPIHIKRAWQVRNMLNFEIRYYGDYKIHYINLVKEPGTLTAADQPIQLEFRHNDNGDAKRIPITTVVTFDLSSIQISGLDSVKYTVTSTEYEGADFKYNGTYKYGNN